MSDFAGAYGCALLTSFLGLFINFYIQTYTKAKARANARPHKTADAAVLSKKSNGLSNSHDDSLVNGYLNAHVKADAITHQFSIQL